ncbi:16S rRNA (guanine(527)-N(7))-methyltransferase RsmG [Corynebacterium pilosum]|uniref:Ribosomal RNA small subunit methyltransferase G n=1 Tax=Corynebacterium pilosum TaxID=35756 RepID=A0A376CLP6_9CORY|nr:RsmG family class I SAM-dependent methyltransferase [Corynebacterium pilosum]STC69202.1 16S rRNA methyltransferase GidB [Corynebacterium pilosum]
MSVEFEPTPDVAKQVFGDRLALAEQYHDSLATTAAERGFIGPKEVSRLWSRHILNCAIISEAFDEGLRVADIGSGAGLPGIPLAIARPDLSITLIEPLLKRSTYLGEVKEQLGLDNVTVIRGRAEDQKLERDAAHIKKVGGGEATIFTVGDDVLAEPSTLIRIERSR